MTPTVIIGAGPAGLTAGLELLRHGHAHVTVVEASDDIGGISKTINHKGNRIDIGGHRFFSKSDWVMDWWRNMLPVALPMGESGQAGETRFRLAYQGAERLLGSGDIHASEDEADVMLVRNRLSRILFGGKFFDYPLKPGVDTAMKLGAAKCVRFGVSYAAAAISPISPELSLEDFFINRFGRQLYLQFFKDYTEKVWGVPCSEISAAWGAQRIKSLSVTKMLAHAMRKRLGGQAAGAEHTSLIEHFLYPKLGPGQMWEVAAREFERLGGQLLKRARVTRIDRVEQRIHAVQVTRPDGSTQQLAADNVVSTMPIKDLVDALSPSLPQQFTSIGKGLQYRDFITVGVLYKKLIRTAASINPVTHLVPDNWIYIQEPGVKVGRLQIFNNWSPHLVADPNTVWVGLEFFARQDDDLWRMSDDALKRLALAEMQQIGMARADDAIDQVVIRMPKAYPGYFGSSYEQFDELREALDSVANLYLVGRNGMHRYNNQDHSMISARLAAQAISCGSREKAAIWAVNIDDDYHEEAPSRSAPELPRDSGFQPTLGVA